MRRLRSRTVWRTVAEAAHRLEHRRRDRGEWRRLRGRREHRCPPGGLAEPGGIYVSAAVMRSAEKMPDLRFARIGRRRAKNIPGARRGLCGSTRRRRRLDRTGRPGTLAVAPGGRRRHARARGRRHLVARRRLARRPLEPAHKPTASPSRSPPRATDTRPVVAVLPFDNLSGDPAQSYFADGLTEDIIADLARNRELLVIARNSTFAFKDQPTDIRTDRGQARGRLRRRRQRAPYRRPAPRRRPADRCQVGRPPVVAQLRPPRRGHLRRAGRPDRADRRLPRLVCPPVRVGGRGVAADREPARLRPRAPGARPLPAWLVRTGRRCSRPAPSTGRRSSSIPTTPPPTPISASRSSRPACSPARDVPRPGGGPGRGPPGDPARARPRPWLSGPELRACRQRRL